MIGRVPCVWQNHFRHHTTKNSNAKLSKALKSRQEPERKNLQVLFLNSRETTKISLRFFFGCASSILWVHTQGTDVGMLFRHTKVFF